ncbi:hypothetical protein A3D77_01405 [Candidatus Gottesmanbacteria bacterium RIFCSPHIGHO2_02_FULL_39_11]|uniref:NH(3)-dependent NAD(+) synthetase n=1 Tax=Candidatus Gottesmanbacteria bacterium RIFCSPHIGHO2_02_FULL_39_11 TaxID=1798382 RepID=A0A1F5ZT51_9BACT|nr:MAG: hypothetical protein A3D77_01405 [Candidatus Gottesmanbacteria bacterium RIFCSPHIGHO2_02_FULL_39_11]
MDLTIDSKLIYEKIIKFISSSFKKSGFSQAVIGLSGGIDSAVSLTLAAQALEKENIYPYILPFGDLNSIGVEDAKLLINHLTIPFDHLTIINIKPLVDPIISLDNSIDDIRKGNIMARMRMILLMDAAKKRNALVVGTENKTEHVLGYYTRFGDEASDVEPIQSLYKTQVRELATYLGIPKKIIAASPTAGLWEGQTDEGEFGFTYEEADQILYLKFEKHLSEEEIVKKRFKREVVGKVLGRVKVNEFKKNLPMVFITE